MTYNERNIYEINSIVDWKLKRERFPLLLRLQLSSSNVLIAVFNCFYLLRMPLREMKTLSKPIGTVSRDSNTNFFNLCRNSYFRLPSATNRSRIRKGFRFPIKFYYISFVFTVPYDVSVFSSALAMQAVPVPWTKLQGKIEIFFRRRRSWRQVQVQVKHQQKLLSDTSLVKFSKEPHWHQPTQLDPEGKSLAAGRKKTVAHVLRCCSSCRSDTE